jgi:hypothetical protein
MVALFSGRYLVVSAEWGDYFAIDCRGIHGSSVVGWVFIWMLFWLNLILDKPTLTDDGFDGVWGAINAFPLISLRV